MWLRSSIPHFKGRIRIEGVLEHGAEEYIST
jgi:hypothetical protein